MASAYTKILVFLILLPTILFAETYISGEVWGTWTPEGNPYYLISDNITVPACSTLIIEAGVEVIFTLDNQDFIVGGTLSCLGALEDSIIFRGEENIIWSCFKTSSIYGSPGLINCEYTSITDCFTGFILSSGYGLTMRNCYIESSGGAAMYPGFTSIHLFDSVIKSPDSINILISATCIGGEIENCELYGKVNIQGGGFMSVKNNNFYLYEVLIMVGVDSYIEGNQCGNMTAGAISGIGSKQVTLIGNNCVYVLLQSPEESLVQGNLIEKQLQIVDGDGVEIIDNDIRGFMPEFLTKAIVATNSYDIVVKNNILTGKYGVYTSGPPSEYTISYNDIFVTEEPFFNCNPSIGNVYGDPLYLGGDPFDYNVRSGSPAVDAGDPALPLDPDGSPGDIGTLFFDWRENHSPSVFASTDSLELWIGDTLSVNFMMYDDNEGAELSFEMPAWLEVESHSYYDLWHIDSVIVSAVVPSGAESFTILAIGEDAEGLLDSAEAYVYLYPENYLRGSLSGILDTTLSPYLVYEDIFLEAEDTLIIMPGVELQFQLTSFDVSGKLICEGTEEDSIIFTTTPQQWGRITIFHDFQDTLSFRYCRVEYGYSYAIEIDSGNVKISNCSFNNNYYSTIYFDFDYETYGLIDSNYFDASIGTVDVVLRNGYCRHNFFDGGGKIGLYSPGAIAEYNLLIGCEIGITASANSIVRYNEIYDAENTGLKSAFPIGSLFYGNYLNGCNKGAEHNTDLISYVYPRFYNNIFEDCTIGFNVKAVNYRSDTSYVYNNVFRNCYTAYRNIDTCDIFTYFENNSITDCDTVFSVASDERIYFANNNIFDNDLNFWGFPVGTGALVGVNANGDSCDVNNNIYLNPFYAEGEPFDYHLRQDSPLIDAGNPAPEFFDPDSTVNDIGLYGGPYGESYPYVGVWNQPNEETPADFTLSQNYPNPFNSSTIFYYTLPNAAKVDIRITNVLGQMVREFHFDNQPPGLYRLEWNGKSSCGTQVSNGIYIYSVNTGKETLSKTMVLLK